MRGVEKGWLGGLVVRLEDGMRDGKREKRRGEPGRGCRFWLRVISSFGGRDAQADVASLHPALRKAAPPAAKPARCWESPVRDATGAAPAPAICTDATAARCCDAKSSVVVAAPLIFRKLAPGPLSPVATVEHWSAGMPSCTAVGASNADPRPEYFVEIPHSLFLRLRFV